MFGGKFGFTRFNLKSRENETVLNIAETYSIAVNGMFGPGKEINIEEYFQSVVTGTSKAFNGLAIRFSTIATVSNTTFVKANIIIKEEFEENVEFIGRFDKTIYLSELSASAVNAKIACGKSMFLTEELNSTLENNIRIGKNILEQFELVSIINCVISIKTLEYLTGIINVTIPPGGELRIDSDTFLALLGNQNILHLYEGDWITFERDTKRVVLSSGTGGNLVGEAIYNERYL